MAAANEPFNAHRIQALSTDARAVSSGLVIDSTPRTPYQQASAAVQNMMSMTLGQAEQLGTTTTQVQASSNCTPRTPYQQASAAVKNMMSMTLGQADQLGTTIQQQACFLNVGMFRLILGDLFLFLDISDWPSVISLCRDSFGVYVKHTGGVPFWSKAIRTHFLQGSDPYSYGYGQFSANWPGGSFDDTGRGCFEQALRKTASGLVTSPIKPDILRSVQVDGVSKDELRGLFMNLLELDRVVKLPLYFPSDSDGYFCAIALPWEPKMEVTPLAVLDALGVLPELKSEDVLGFLGETFLEHCSKMYDDDEDYAEELAAFNKLDAFLKKGDSGSQLMFSSGSENCLCTPFPIFEVASFCGRRVVLGVMTTAVWT